jgi:hypothetical protein
MLQNVDFKDSAELVAGVQEKVMVDEAVNLTYFCSFVGWWAERAEEIEQLVPDLLRKEEGRRVKTRRYFSSQPLKQDLPTPVARPAMRQHKKYLRERQQKQRKKGEDIQNEIENRISELKYDKLLKVGEAN